MSYIVFFAGLFLWTVTVVEGYPSYVNCDFTVQSGKSSAGTNLMTTSSGNIMGSVPEERNDLVSAATWSTTDEEVRLTFGAGVKSRGFIHVSSGTLTGANKCSNSRYEFSSKPSSITWNSPSDETASVTISVATAGGYGLVSRQSITLTKESILASPTTTTTEATTTEATTTEATTTEATTTEAPTTTTTEATTTETVVKISPSPISSSPSPSSSVPKLPSTSTPLPYYVLQNATIEFEREFFDLVTGDVADCEHAWDCGPYISFGYHADTAVHARYDFVEGKAAASQYPISQYSAMTCAQMPLCNYRNVATCEHSITDSFASEYFIVVHTGAENYFKVRFLSEDDGSNTATFAYERIKKCELKSSTTTTQTQNQNCKLGNCCGTGTKWNGEKCVPSYHDIIESCGWNDDQSEWGCKTMCQ